MDYFSELEVTVARALAEDIGTGDITASLVNEDNQARATVITREKAIICGRPWVNEVLRQVDENIQINWQVNEGAETAAGSVLFSLAGKARSLLTAERTALNFLQLLSGTATRTKHFVDLISQTNATLLDTRKTIPGLRLAQKYAVKTGGAENHRIGLFDAFLIKENHIEASGSIRQAIDARPDWIMLDNFSLEDMVTAVATTSGSGIKLEASGGIDNEEELIKIATTGVDYISVGALTKHNEAIDLSMRLE